MDLLRESKIKSVLFNMIAVTNTKQDRDYVTSVVKNAREKNLIPDKEYFALMKEIQDLRKSGDK